jgi:gamma-glutamyltranspeptidase/glutathione hydrolase
MLEFIRNRITPPLLVIAAVAVSCTTTTNEETKELPGAGPVVERLVAEPFRSSYGMVATGSADANRIAIDILESGGNAVDAAVAAALALGVVDPGDCGLGGTTYMLIRLADGRATVIDGSALVPLRVNRDRLLDMQERGIEFGMELAAVPVLLAALDHAAKRYGTLPLADLIEPAIGLAERGYYPTPFQEVSIQSYLDQLRQSDFLKQLVLDGGDTPPTTTALQKRPVLEGTLRRIAVGGSHEFYRGSIAQEIEDDMMKRGGFVSRDDLGIVRVRETTPLRGTYRDTEVLAIPYPSMGGAVLEALAILGRYPSEFLSQDTAERHQVFAEAFHLAIVDHERFLANDTMIAQQARDRLVSEEFAAERASLIHPRQPVVTDEFPEVSGAKNDDGHTTQVSVIDRWGNAVSLTQTLGRFFGNKRASADLGFPYNSLLEGHTNLVGRAPIPTYMCPSIVTKDDQVLLVLGSASSARIPGVVASVISNVVDRDMDLADAVIAPRVLWSTMQQLGVYAEVFPPITAEQIDELARYGYDPILRAQLPVRQSRFSRFGAVNAVHFDRETGVMTGVGDPRRNGSALGASQ